MADLGPAYTDAIYKPATDPDTYAAEQIVARMLPEQSSSGEKAYLSAFKEGIGLTPEQINIAFRTKYGSDAPAHILSDFVGKNKGGSAKGQLGFYNRVMRGDFTRMSDDRSRELNLPYLESAAQEKAKLQEMEAMRPSLLSLAGGIPEITSAIQEGQQQIKAEVDPLKKRYNDLIANITGRYDTLTEQVSNRGKSAIDRSTLAIANELAKRGITNTSGLFGTEVAKTVNPIELEIASMLKDIGYERGEKLTELGYAREKDLRELANMIVNLGLEGVSQKRDIRNQMAQILSGAASTGLSRGTQSFQNYINNKVKLKQQEIANRTAKFQQDLYDAAERLGIDKIAQAEYLGQEQTPTYQLKEFDDTLYSFDPTTGSIQALMQALGGGGESGIGTGFTDTSNSGSGWSLIPQSQNSNGSWSFVK